MTMMVICAVRDRAVDAYGIPFFAKHENEAIRSFQDEVNRKESVFYAHPDDYDLYFIGRFDDASGVVDTSERVSMLVAGKSVFRAVESK